MSNYNSNYEIAQAISERIGSEPISFDSAYEICLQIYNELGGEPGQFDSVYEILLGILPLVGGGIASKVIDDHSIATDKTWSSNKLSNMFAAIPQPEAGENISIEHNKISTKGYKFDDEPKTTLTLIDDILHDKGMAAGSSLGLKISGAAGTTTYTWSDDFDGLFAQIIQMGLLPGVGATYQTANGKSGVIAAVDATTITFKETLDADNALTNEPVDYLVNTKQLFSFTEGILDYIETDTSLYEITLSGAAGATTYTYNYDTLISIYREGSIFKLQDGRSAKAISIDEANSTITFEETFDANNELSDALVTSVAKKNNASGIYSHAEGGLVEGNSVYTNYASGQGSHAEGVGSIASGQGSHAEGVGSIASGLGSHAEGKDSTASGEASHAEGVGSIASGLCSHAEGYYNVKARNTAEHAEGTSNVSHKVSDSYGNAGNTQHSVGIGGEGAGKNAFEIMQNGDIYVLGIGGYQGSYIKFQDATIKTLQELIKSLESRVLDLEHRVFKLEHPQPAE